MKSLIKKIKTFGDFSAYTKNDEEEIKAFKKIEKSLEDIPAIYYFKPPLVLDGGYFDKEPDSIWFNPYIGIGVIEIKLWDKEYLKDKEFSSDGYLREKKGLISKIFSSSKSKNLNRNPYFQIRQYERFILSLLEGKGYIPVKGFVFFPNLKEKDIESLDDSIKSFIEKNINITIFGNYDRNKIKETIIKSLGARGQIEPLSEDKFEDIRKALFPLIRVPKRDIDKFTYEDIKILDLSQEGLLYKVGKIEKSIPYKDKVLRGTAGTGKSVVLLSKAIYEKRKNRKVLVLSFTNSLVNEMKESLKTLVKSSKLQPEIVEDIEFSTVDKKIQEIARYLRLENASLKDVLNTLNENPLPEELTYDVLLIDESQDLTKDKILFIHHLKRSRYIAIWGIDETQRIYANDDDNEYSWKWKDVQVDASGANTQVLRKVYRNPSKVMQFARQFLTADTVMAKRLKELDLENIEVSRVDEDSTSIEFDNSGENTLSFTIIGKVRSLLKNGYKPNEILILLPTKKDVDFIGKKMSEYFKKTEIIHYFSSDSQKNDKSTHTDKINITTYHSSKGLERPVVIVAKINMLPFVRKDEDGNIIKPKIEEVRTDRRLMFVAMTRANKKLILIHDDKYINPNDRYYKNFGEEIRDILKP